MLHSLRQDVLVKIPELDVIDCVVGHLQEQDAKRKQEIMSSLNYPVSWTALEECVVRVEDFPRDDHIPGHSMKNLSGNVFCLSPLPQEPSRVLTLLSFEDDVESVLPFFGTSPGRIQ